MLITKEMRSRNKISFGGNREKAIKRDGNKCVQCGVTRRQHINRYNRDITVDHIKGKEFGSSMNNLQTLCLYCHGKKDGKKCKIYCFGSKAPAAVFCEKEVLKIRKDFANGNERMYKTSLILAKKHKVHVMTIYRILLRATWRHI